MQARPLDHRRREFSRHADRDADARAVVARAAPARDDAARVPASGRRARSRRACG